jgi:hypothetical protein
VEGHVLAEHGNERFAVEEPRRDRLPRGAGMVLRHHGDAAHAEALHVETAGGEAEIERLGRDEVLDRLRAARHEPDRDARPLAHERRGDFRQERDGGAGLARDHQPSRLRLPDIEDRLRQAVDAGKALRHLAVKQQRLGGRLEPPRLAVEEREADLPLEPRDLRAYRRLRHADRRGGAGRGPVLHHGAEDFELPEIHADKTCLCPIYKLTLRKHLAQSGASETISTVA